MPSKFLGSTIADARNHDNSNVSRILPLTTFRTIDLGGKKISDRLFSRFYGETRVSYFAGGHKLFQFGPDRAIIMKVKHFGHEPAFTG